MKAGLVMAGQKGFAGKLGTHVEAFAMRYGIEGADDAAAERRARLPGTGLERLFLDFQPVLKGFGEIDECLRSFTDPFARLGNAVAPLVQMVGPGMKRWAAAESLMARGWVPNSTTPFELVEKCGDDDARLKEALLAHYGDNWSSVRGCLEAAVASRDIDDEAKAVFREALDAHECGLYRCVSRLLFPEFERVIRQVLLDGDAVGIRHGRLERKLAEESGRLRISEIPAGVQGMAMFKYLTGGTRGPRVVVDRSGDPAPGYTPGLYVTVDKTNYEHAGQSPIPTRHAVAHGLFAYSSPQSSLNALFIADYLFLIICRLSRRKTEDDALSS